MMEKLVIYSFRLVNRGFIGIRGNDGEVGYYVMRILKGYIKNGFCSRKVI